MEKKEIDITDIVANVAKMVARELEKNSDYTLAHDILKKLKEKQTHKLKRTNKHTN